MIVADSSSIISLAVNCLSPLLGNLGVQFAITPRVYDEIITKPSTSKRFALESMRINRLLSRGDIVVEKPSTTLGEQILDASNRIYRIKGRDLKIIHAAEAEALGVAGEDDAKALLIDERTTRLLIENPRELRNLLSHRNKSKVELNESNLKKLQGILPDVPVIRSSDVTAVAYEKGVLTRMHAVKDKTVLSAALSALKYSGCAITWDEIQEYEKAVI